MKYVPSLPLLLMGLPITPNQHMKIRATYLYMENSLLKIYPKIVHKWANDVLTPIHTVAVTPTHTVAITQKRTVLQGCDNVVRTDTQIPNP